MLPVLESASDGEVQIRDVIDRLADAYHLTETEKTEPLPSGTQTRFACRVRWARTYLVKAGLLEASRRAHVRLTDRGRGVLADSPDIIDTAYLHQFTEFKKFYRPMSATRRPCARHACDAARDITPADEAVRAAHRAIDRALARDLIARILAADPSFFEKLVIDLLVALGYGSSLEDAARRLGRRGDGGVDGVINQDALGVDQVYVQAKRYDPAATVSASEIRDFFGSLDTFKASKGVFVTTSRYSTAARQAAERMSKRIVLIDGARLANLMIRHNVGVRVAHTIHLKKLDDDFFPG
jgi:restriction system protein